MAKSAAIPLLRWPLLAPPLFVLFCCLLPAQAQVATPEAPGAISGTVFDPNGNTVASATVKLAQPGQTNQPQAMSDSEGRFAFAGIPAGPFVITVSAEGFASQESSGILHPQEALDLPRIALTIAAATTEVQVNVTRYELAEEQVKVEETQRVLGVIPNYFVSYQKDTLPLRPRQKFELAWKTSVDPVTFAFSGAFAGVEQAQNSYRGYGQGAQGYAKRLGASYADAFIGIMIGGAILPSVFKQDPRYYYKGTGSTRSRILYALANAVICKGDNGHWQADYSGIMGSLAAAGISNLYYPASSRNGARLTFENTLIGIGGSGLANLFQEFLVRQVDPSHPRPANHRSVTADHQFSNLRHQWSTNRGGGQKFA